MIPLARQLVDAVDVGGALAVLLVQGQVGRLPVLLPGSEGWQTIEPGQSFEVPANSKFGIKIGTVTDYCCSYLD